MESSHWTLIIILGLLVGLVAYNLCRLYLRFIPYSVALIILGAAISGILMATYHEKTKPYMDAISNMDPHLFMQIFLPILIFFSVFSINYHTLTNVFWPAMLLAVPGVLLNATLTAILFAYILPYRWKFKIALLFGSIISATDPVAVVTLLREIKACPSLATLIEAESLFNDASAIILFSLTLKFIDDKTGENTPQYYVLHAFIMLMAPLLGIFASLFLNFCVSRVIDDDITETGIFFLGANMVFFVAEKVGSSGVLALVTMAILVARNKGDISCKGLTNLEHFWGLLEFFAKTLIFLISGVLVLLKTAFEITRVQWVDLGYLFIIYVWIHLTRLVTLGILYFPMRYFDSSYGYKNMAVLWYGALRGVIGLSLALIVDSNKNIDEGVKERIIFHICGIVILTLLINGSTIRFLLRVLKIKGSLYQSDFLIRSSLKHLQNMSSRMLQILAQNNHFTGANWEKVREKLPDYEKLLKTEDYSIRNEENSEMMELNIRYRLICSMDSFYWKQHNDGMITTKIYKILYDSAELAMDTNNIENHWNEIKKHFKLNVFIHFMNKFRVLENLTNKATFDSIYGTVQLLTSLIFAADRTGIVINKFPEWKSNSMKKVESEIHDIRQKAYAELNLIQKMYPDVYRAIQTHNAQVFMLNKDIHNITKMKKEGIIQNSECEEMTSYIEKTLYGLRKTDHVITEDRSFSAFSNLPFISNIDIHKVHQMFSRTTAKIYSEDQIIYKENLKKNGFYIIVRGLVEVSRAPNYKHTCGPGSTINLWSAVSNNNSISTAKCITTVSTVKVPQKQIEEIKKNHESEEMLWKSTAFVIMKMMLIGVSSDERTGFRLGEICHSGSLRRLNGTVLISCKVLLLQGMAMATDNTKYVAPCIIETQGTQLSKNADLTICEMMVKFNDAVVLVMDGQGSMRDANFEGIANSPVEAAQPIVRQDSIGLIYVKGSAESNRVELHDAQGLLRRPSIVTLPGRKNSVI